MTYRSFYIFYVVCFCCLQIHAQSQLKDITLKSTGISNKSEIINYKQIVNKILKHDELFVMFYLDAALIIDPNADTQVIKQIETDNPWESLKEYLYDKSDIYFCPSGTQLDVAIEYMPCPLDENTIMSSQYGMYRLSSPEELFKNRGESFRSSNHKAVVYGGLNYDETINNKPLLAFNRNRGTEGYEKLKNAESEAQYIDSLLRKQNVEVAFMSGNNGSEMSFYKIPSTRADILHVASHGEYQPDDDNFTSHSLEEWMMSHSALILSGYNTSSSNSNEDGRLTAYEISQTDLSHIKLAVLSVCESAKGDIVENEVYGLLKGFKMAGAGTLLLTLDTVNDEITKLLMIRFYENLFRGNDPRSALETAQRFLQRYLVRYDNGKYKNSEEWKKFILVDDLDRNIGKDVTDYEREYFLNDIVGLRDLYSATKLFPNWNKVKMHLSDNDIVIRFFTYSISGDIHHRMPYIALIGNVKSNDIKIKRLFTVSDENFNSFIFERQPTDDFFKLYDNVIWKSLTTEIKGSNRIYFLPVGVINNVPIECLESVIDEYEFYRVSSIDVLKSKKTRSENEGRRFSSFGGLYYDCGDTRIEYNLFNAASTRSIALNVSYLPSTLKEIETINSIARSSGKSTRMFTKCEGTEAAFRNLVYNDKIDAVHFSTHGFVLNKSLSISPKSFSDYLFGHNGLLLSGVNDIIDGGFDNDGEGVFTGTEISHLNMQNLQFVALSACDTGKGVDKYSRLLSENSWSLANAFIKSGVHCVLCSLWSVDDSSTSQLMIEFYKNWFVKKMSPRLSLEEARKKLRNIPKWNNPKYWSAFILIDDIE